MRILLRLSLTWSWGLNLVLWLAVLASPSRADLVGYWNFDGNVLDHSGSGNDGDLVGGSYVNDVPPVLGAGQALSFEDMLEHVFIAADPSLDSNVFTLSMFINDRGQFSGINRFTSRESDTLETGIDQVFGSQSISYYSPLTGWQTTTEIPELDTWHHVAFTSSGSEMTVYKDGEPVFGPVPFLAAPTGYMHIGNRWNDIEGFDGLMDDVALWNVALDAAGIAQLAAGTRTPLTVKEPEPPVPPVVITIASSVDSWQLSTETIDGGDPAEWDPSADPPPPDASTFTLDPLPTEPGVIGHIHNAAGALGVAGLTADSNVHYYRTTFDLNHIDSISAEILLAIDNGAQVYLNGELLATETSFLVENWGMPLPGISIAEDGALSVVKFDSSADKFTNWRVGENEIVLAVRNPNSENDPAGGFAFRMNLTLPDSGLTGDFNHDSVLDVGDIDLLTAESSSGNHNPAFNLNDDDLVDSTDVEIWAHELANIWMGDANVDGEFNSADFVSVFVIGKYEQNEAAVWSEGDWNGDGRFNSSDFVVAFVDGGYEQGPRPAVAAVPEPGGWVLLLMAVAGLIMRERPVRSRLRQ